MQGKKNAIACEYGTPSRITAKVIPTMGSKKPAGECGPLGQLYANIGRRGAGTLIGQLKHAVVCPNDPTSRGIALLALDAQLPDCRAVVPHLGATAASGEKDHQEYERIPDHRQSSMRFGLAEFPHSPFLANRSSIRAAPKSPLSCLDADDIRSQSRSSVRLPIAPGVSTDSTSSRWSASITASYWSGVSVIAVP